MYSNSLTIWGFDGNVEIERTIRLNVDLVEVLNGVEINMVVVV